MHPEEFAELFNTILINVTGFFRDAPTWEYLASDVVPQLLGQAPADAPIRIWCAGCATGEEAYTRGDGVRERAGRAAFLDRVKIYATDVDEEALDVARHAAYPAAPGRGRPARRARAVLRARRRALRVPQATCAAR